MQRATAEKKRHLTRVLATCTFLRGCCTYVALHRDFARGDIPEKTWHAGNDATFRIVPRFCHAAYDAYFPSVQRSDRGTSRRDHLCNGSQLVVRLSLQSSAIWCSSLGTRHLLSLLRILAMSGKAGNYRVSIGLY